ncbi:hypothetical protein PN36_08355 [Candidatus Thiomargarita nelsonii]|uniref:Uncharacterized protein n=1 Tax=Candidatus Thiomargarita nelsonii TaxID=1003181 RepID=A0A0A6P6Z9_9GAMM|nr:hypothetical protein PN36_08355 [Candidatus Thiomargarita nelsonii]
MELCLKVIPNRSKYAQIKRCYCEKGHDGRCEEFPYLKHLAHHFKQVANKIKRDATKTTGAAWKSENAGPNRIDRWVMLLSDEELEQYGIKMMALKQTVVAKLREKAASYEDCMAVAAKLTWIVYQMLDAPEAPENIKKHLEACFGKFQAGATKCIVCKMPLSFRSFSQAKRGRAKIETAHMNPRIHNANNVGFAHRECNIAQGDKTLDEFYTWIAQILERVQSSTS